MELQNSKDWAKVYRACNFIEKGVCEYANERVYVSQDALQKSLMTMKGRPVIIDHKTGITPENMQEYAVGYVTGVELNQFEAGCDCQFVIFDDKGKEVIADGYSVSCAYKPIAFGPGGTWHNVPYDREIVELEFTHLALVQNPRYEDAKVYENAKDRDGKEGRWITVKGTHVFIKEGQSVEDAMKDAFKSSSTEKKEKGLEGKYKGKDKYDPNELLKDIKRAKEEGHVDDVMDFLGIEKAEKGTAFLGAELEGKYAEEDADFDPEQMKKDIKKAQSIGYKTVESIASFLGLDEDEVRETIGSSQTSSGDEEIEEQLDDLEDQIRDAKRRLSKTAPADRKTQANIKQEIKDLESMYDYKASRLSKGDDRSGSSFDEEGFKKFVEANKKKGEFKLEVSDFIYKSKDMPLGVVREVISDDDLIKGLKDAQAFQYVSDEVFDKIDEALRKRSGSNLTMLSNLHQKVADEIEEYARQFKEYNKEEKHNSKEDTMNVEEFFNKMGEIIEEKFNACKGKMNEADEEEKENEDDDKFEMDGEVYSKKELVNAFKEKKNAEDEEEKEEKDEEEEKQNSNDEFFNAMEQRMLQYNKEEGDKVQVYTQQKGLERGKAIYGK